MVFEKPGDFVGTDEESAIGNLETNPGLEQVESVGGTLLEATFLGRTHRVEHSKIAGGDLLPVRDPGFLVARVPEGHVVGGPVEEFFAARYRHVAIPSFWFSNRSARGSFGFCGVENSGYGTAPATAKTSPLDATAPSRDGMASQDTESSASR